MNVLLNAEIYTGEDKISNGYVRFDETIQEVGTMNDYSPMEGETVLDAEGARLLPGFIDIHSHGGYGYDNMNGDPEKINEMVENMLQEGITTYFGTTMTQSYEHIEQALTGIKKAAERNPMIQGIHLEGPFISAVFKGAQPEEYIRAPDADTMRKWNDLTGGMIKLVTYAPEKENVRPFEEYCKEAGIVLSAGHSNATREELKTSQATHITHLYNGQRGLHHREAGVAGHGLLEEDIYVEMIVDGFHIHPDMVRLAYRMKGPERIHLITDAMRAKGMPEGESELGGQKVRVKDKQARLKSGSLAGSILTFPDAVKNFMEFTGCSLEEAVKMSSVNQAREFGLEKKGGIAKGKDADMVLLNEAFQVQQTISYGRVIAFK